jgi:hypothetical protein
MKVFTKLLFTIFFSLICYASFSQCKYVITKDAKERKISIPSDFPVKLSTGNPAQDQSDFDAALAKWKKANITLINFAITPKEISDGTYIEIPRSIYLSFSADKQKVVNAFPDFYKIIQ